MIWAMIIFVGVGINGIAGVSVDGFATESLCKAAAAEVRKEFTRIHTVCVQVK